MHPSRRLKCTIVVMCCPSSFLRLSLTIHLFDFSEAAEHNSTKLDRKQDLHVLYQVLCFLGRSEKRDGRPGLWLAEIFSTSLKPLNIIQRNLTERKISTFSCKFVFFGPMEKNPRWPSRLWLAGTFSTSLKPLNGISDFMRARSARNEILIIW